MVKIIIPHDFRLFLISVLAHFLSCTVVIIINHTIAEWSPRFHITKNSWQPLSLLVDGARLGHKVQDPLMSLDLSMELRFSSNEVKCGTDSPPPMRNASHVMR